MKPYVSIDIETTGLDPERCQILEIGVVLDNGGPLDKCPVFHRYLDYGYFKGEAFALQLNAEIFRKLAGCTDEKDLPIVKPGNVVYQLRDWLATYWIDPKRIPVAGKNFASFDRQFLERLEGFKENLRFNHRTLDPAMLFFDFENHDWLPDTKKCMQIAGIPGEVAHTAVDDAKMVIQLIRHAQEKKRDTEKYILELRETIRRGV